MLTLAIFTPLLGALALASIPKVTEVQARVLAVVMATLPLLVLLGVWLRLDPAGPMFQSVAEVPWIPSLGVARRVGVGGIALATAFMRALLFLGDTAWPPVPQGPDRHYYD